MTAVETGPGYTVGAARWQLRAVRVLVTVVATAYGQNLPVPMWTVSPCSWEITGQLWANDTAGLQAWAQAYGATVNWDRHDGKRPEIILILSGVELHIWTLVDPVRAGEQ